MAISSKNVLKWLFGTLTQGGADAFIQASIATPFGVDKSVGVVKQIDFFWPRIATNAGAAVNQEFALTVKSFAAMPVPGTDRSLLLARRRYAEMVTSGAYSYLGYQTLLAGIDWPEDQPLIMAEPTWYAQFDSNSTGLTSTAYIKIGYSEDTMNDADRFALQAARLAS